jgi:GGDEF domain-containing protein
MPRRLKLARPEELDRALAARRPSKWRTLMLFDVDHFAAAHKGAQDRALDVIGRLLSAELGQSAKAYRHSRDGVAVLTELDPADALLAADRIRTHFAARLGASSPALTLSAGIGTPPSRRGDLMLMLWSAESALVRAKEAGRNRVAITPGEAMVMKSAYYPRTLLDRLARAAREINRPESAILRDALERFLRERDRRPGTEDD